MLAGKFDSFTFYWPCLCWGPSSVKPGLPQAGEWSLPLRTNWSLRTLQMSTTCRIITETAIQNICEYHPWVKKKTCVITLFCSFKSRPVAVSWLCSSRSTCPLIGWGLWGPRDFKGRHSGHSVVETFLYSTAVNHVLDARDGQRRLGHVGGYDTQTSARRGRPEHLQSKNHVIILLYGFSQFEMHPMDYLLDNNVWKIYNLLFPRVQTG